LDGISCTPVHGHCQPAASAMLHAIPHETLAGNGDFSGETYTMDRTGPQADAINRLDANPTDAA